MFDSCAEKVEFKYGIVGEIHYDEDPQDPRQNYDHAATMLCGHRNYQLGDEQISGENAALNHIAQEPGVEIVCSNCEQEITEHYDSYYHLATEGDIYKDLTDADYLCGGTAIKPKLTNVVVLPLYLYDHSGISMSTSAFGDPWDSGQVGVIYTTHATILSEQGVVTEETISNATKWMIGEVDEYDKYLTGQVFGYVIKDSDDEILDSCWGFIGEEHVMEEMTSVADYHVSKIQQKLDAIGMTFATVGYL